MVCQQTFMICADGSKQMWYLIQNLNSWTNKVANKNYNMNGCILCTYVSPVFHAGSQKMTITDMHTCSSTGDVFNAIHVHTVFSER